MTHLSSFLELLREGIFAITYIPLHLCVSEEPESKARTSVAPWDSFSTFPLPSNRSGHALGLEDRSFWGQVWVRSPRGYASRSMLGSGGSVLLSRPEVLAFKHAQEFLHSAIEFKAIGRLGRRGIGKGLGVGLRCGSS